MTARFRHLGLPTIVAGLCTLGGMLPAASQTLVAVELEQPVVSIEAEALLRVALERDGGGSAWCGLHIDFGNGTSRDVRVGEQGEADLRLRLAYRYPSPGLYTIRIQGRSMTRGLRSAGACAGAPKTAMVRVVDSAVGALAAPQAGRADALPLSTAPLPSPAPTAPLPPPRQGSEGVPPSSRAEPVPSADAGLGAAATATAVRRPAAPTTAQARPGDMVALPSFDSPPRRAVPGPAAPPATLSSVPAQEGASPPPQMSGTPNAQLSSPARPPSPTAGASCRSGPAMEAREYTQPEVLGRPPGERARMCFYRATSSGAEYLNFFPSGHYYHTSSSGAGGFAASVAVYGTVRGTYGFQSGNVLATRTGYQGTGVSTSNRGAGTQRELDVSGQTALEREMTLPNCQKITYRDELVPAQLGASSGHPSHIVIRGVRWEHYRIDCPAWAGWIRD